MSALLEKSPRPYSAKRASVTAQLSAAGRGLQRERGLCLALRAWTWVIGFIVAALAADVVLHLNGAGRLVLDLVLAALVLGVAGVAMWVAWVRKPSFEHVARVLEDRDAQLGSKLINILQLREQTEDERLAPLTRELADVAIGGYADELRAVDLPRLARSDRPREEAKRAGFGLLGLLMLSGLCWNITRTEWPRFLDPFGDHPPYSFTRIEISEPGTDASVVVYGQSILITAKTAGHHPGELFLSYHAPDAPGQATTLPMFDKGESGFTQQIENIHHDLVIVAHTKARHSVSKQRRVGVILTPKLEAAFVKIAPPAYTGLKTDEHPLQFKSLKALAGTELTFRLRSNRPLREGRIDFTRAHDDVQAFPLVVSSGNENEVSGTLTAKDAGRLAFTLVDRDGHPSQETWECELQVIFDLGPEVQVTTPPADAFVALDFKIDAVIEAQDDYGVKTVRIHKAVNGVYGEPQVTHYDTVVRNVRDSLPLDLNTMDLDSGDTITLFAEAIDTAPEPHLARSKPVTLTVITVEEYNDFLRERSDLADIEAKYTDLFNRLRELVEQQSALGEQAEALKKQLEQGPNEAAQKKFDELMAKQGELNNKLNKMADEMDKFVREEPVYDLESELQETLSEKAEEIRESTKENQSATDDLAQRSTTPQGDRKLDAPMAGEMKKASDEQLARLGGAEQQGREQVTQPLEDLALMQEILKDINRIQQLDDAQKQLAGQAKAYNRAGPLTREDQLALKDLAAAQKAVGDELQEVEDKLWNDGKAAQEKFPKAAQSAKKIAEMMGDLRLQMHANNATEAMLQGKGDQSAQLAQRVSDELDKLFSECQSQGQQMSDEMDGYLGLKRGMQAGNNFQQMMQSRKFGNGRKFGMGKASGPGGQGDSGFAVSAQPNVPVLGNETRISQPSKPGNGGHSQAKADARTSPAAVDKTDVTHGLKPIDRESDAVQGESSIEQYSDLVDKYFKAITK